MLFCSLAYLFAFSGYSGPIFRTYLLFIFNLYVCICIYFDFFYLPHTQYNFQQRYIYSRLVAFAILYIPSVCIYVYSVYISFRILTLHFRINLNHRRFKPTHAATLHDIYSYMIFIQILLLYMTICTSRAYINVLMHWYVNSMERKK